MRGKVKKPGRQLHQNRIAFARPMACLEERMRDRGIEPRLPGWKPGVVPLDQSRRVITIKSERKERESNPQGSSLARSQIGCRHHSACPSGSRVEWTAGESNPDFLVAGQVSSRWTSSPNLSVVSCPWCVASENNHANMRHFPHRRGREVIPEGVEPPFPLCKRGVVAIGPRDACSVWHQ